MWVDSIEAATILESSLPPAGRIGVLVELGANGGRTGARTESEAEAIAERVAASPVLDLRGVAGYEGALGHDRSPTALHAVEEYCSALAQLIERVRPLVEGTPWITAGGSAYFDLVADAIGGIPDTRAILRSGAYIVHDNGFYRDISPLDAINGTAEDDALIPAMRAYSRVVSQPEPGLALLDAGKRDLPFDEGLPVPLGVASGLGSEERELNAEIVALNDQHAFMRWTSDASINIGDVVTLGLSHPCTAFDKWRLIPVVDANGLVVEAVESFF